MMPPTPTADAATYAEFLRGIGHRVVAGPSVCWFDASRLFFLSAPPHRLYTPTADDMRVAFRQLPCLGVRFASEVEGPGKLSYQIVCTAADYGLELLSGNTRSKVRRGLKRCRVDPVPFSVLAAEGRRAHEDTVERQGREGILSGARWQHFCAAAADSPGFEAWGAWCGEDLAAFLVTVTFDDTVEFLLARSRSDRLGAYPNNALLFTVTEEMLVQRRVPQITFGLESLEPVAPLDDFKFSMGFCKRPLRQRVVFHPVLQTLLRHAPVRAALRRWSERRAQSSTWRKAAGLLRFAEEGTA
jgi:hypothetical protein